MAVIATKNLSSLKLYLDKGLDQNSKQIKVQKLSALSTPLLLTKTCWTLQTQSLLSKNTKSTTLLG